LRHVAHPAQAEEARTVKLYFPPFPWNNISETAKDFVRHLLDVEEDRRFTAEQALAHPVSVPPHLARVHQADDTTPSEVLLTDTYFFSLQWLQAVPTPELAPAERSSEDSAATTSTEEHTTSSDAVESSEEDHYPQMEKRATFATAPETRVGA
jgi:serine/threonine protein kinase